MNNVLLFVALLLSHSVHAAGSESEALAKWQGHVNQGVDAVKKGDLISAEKHFLSAKETISSFGNTPTLAGTYSNLGWVYEEGNKLDEAENSYGAAIQITQETRGMHHPELIPDLYHLGALKNKRKQYAEAMQLLNYGVVVIEKHKLDLSPLVYAVFEEIIEVHTNMGNEKMVEILKPKLAEMKKWLKK